MQKSLGGRGNKIHKRFCYGACQEELELDRFSTNMQKSDKDGADGWRRCEVCKDAKVAARPPPSKAAEQDEYGPAAIDNPNVRVGGAPLRLGKSKLLGQPNKPGGGEQSTLDKFSGKPEAAAQAAHEPSSGSTVVVTTVGTTADTTSGTAVGAASGTSSGAASAAAPPIELQALQALQPAPLGAAGGANPQGAGVQPAPHARAAQEASSHAREGEGAARGG